MFSPGKQLVSHVPPVTAQRLQCELLCDLTASVSVRRARVLTAAATGRRTEARQGQPRSVQLQGQAARCSDRHRTCSRRAAVPPRDLLPVCSQHVTEEPTVLNRSRCQASVQARKVQLYCVSSGILLSAENRSGQRPKSTAAAVLAVNAQEIFEV